MKGVFFSAAIAALASSASAHSPNRAHQMLHARQEAVCSDQCSTVLSTFYGEPTLLNPRGDEESSSPSTPEVVETSETTPEVTTSAATTPPVVPTGEVSTFSEPGTYTIPEGTIVLSDSTSATQYRPTTVAPGTTTVTPFVTEYPPGTYTRSKTYVTVTVKDYIYVCPPYSTVSTDEPTALAQEEEKPTTTKVAKPPKETSSEAAEPTSVVQAEEKATTKTDKPSKDSSPPQNNGGSLGNDGDRWAITYTPFTEDTGDCKTRDAVFKDVQKIKKMGFSTIRLYATDCDTLPNVGDAAEKFGMRLLVGLFVKEAGCGYSGWNKEQTEAISKWAKWGLVDMVVVGNEAIFSGHCSGSQLAGLIKTVKGKLQGAGYKGPFTTAETVDVWAKNGDALCDVVDIAGAQTHAYFDPNTASKDAGTFVKGQLEIVKKVCNKETVSLECGWPSKGTCNGKACATEEDQRKALQSIRKEIGGKVAFFTYGLAMWKSDQTACKCEQFFDCTSVFSS